MKYDDIVIGQKVRYTEDGKIYTVKSKYTEEVGAGCHSFDMDFLKLEDDNGDTRYDVTSNNVVNVDLTLDEVKKEFLFSYIEHQGIYHYRKLYENTTGDKIKAIHWYDNGQIAIDTEKYGLIQNRI